MKIDVGEGEDRALSVFAGFCFRSFQEAAFLVQIVSKKLAVSPSFFDFLEKMAS